MKKVFVISLALLLSLFAAAQDTATHYRIHYRMTSFSYGDDVQKSIKCSFHTSFRQVSGIVPFYSSGKEQYGIQFEVLKSQMLEGPEYFIRQAYYQKIGDEWVLISQSDPTPIYIATAKTASKECKNSYESLDFKVVYCVDLYLE